MIQRIQTLFLIAVTILIGILLFVPFATVSFEDMLYQFKADSLAGLTEGSEVNIMFWPLFILIVIMMLIPFATIFLYKKRLLQVRLCVFSSILNALFYVLFYFELSTVLKVMPGAIVNYYYPALAVPLCCIVLNIISIKKIMQDEILVKSYDRIR